MKCQHDSCDRDGTECFLPDNESKKPDYHYCMKHANQHGFCWGCGGFWGGVERFEFSRFCGGIEGLCENCGDAFVEEFADEEDEEEEEYDDHYSYYG